MACPKVQAPPPPDKRDSGAMRLHSEAHSVFVLAVTDLHEGPEQQQQVQAMLRA